MSLLTDALKRAEAASQETPYSRQPAEARIASEAPAPPYRGDESGRPAGATVPKRRLQADQALLEAMRRFLVALLLTAGAAAAWWWPKQTNTLPAPDQTPTGSPAPPSPSPNEEIPASIFSRNFRSTADGDTDLLTRSQATPQNATPSPTHHAPLEIEQSSRRRAPPSASPDATAEFLHAQDSLLRHDLEAAHASLERALRLAPEYPDILLGLAALAEHRGQREEANELRERARQADPIDPTTQAAFWAAPPGTHDTFEAESRLKTLIAEHPESAPLRFALGNLHARRYQWPEAGLAYAEAVAIDPGHPDYLFNLAVALDHQHRIGQAVHHYRLALEAAGFRPATFPAEQVRRRLGELAEEP